MRVLRRDFFNVSRPDIFNVIPIGDIHIGADACDEKLLKRLVDRIANQPNTYWIGLGDYADNIGPKDPRWAAGGVAGWVKVADLVDLAKAQRERFLSIVEPIAPKCLAMIEGNHETAIKRHYERDIYLETVAGIKELGNPYEELALGYNGWLALNFYRSDKRQGVSQIKFYLHHGFVGGKLAGAKALNMQRLLWAYDADIIIMGHSHNTGIQIESKYRLVGSKIQLVNSYGGYSGTFLKPFSGQGSTYGEIKGYFPLPIGGVEVALRPGAANVNRRISMTAVSR